MVIKSITIQPILYILLLENNKYYIGITLNLNQRLAQHFTGEGSQFTKKYRPLEVHKIIYNNNINESYENKIFFINFINFIKFKFINIFFFTSFL